MTTRKTSEPRRIPTIEEFWEIFTRSQIELQKEREVRRKELEARRKKRAAQQEKLEKEQAERQKEWAERQKQWEKERAERRKELDRSMAVSHARMEEAERLMKRVAANVGGLNRSLGELVEILIAARLWEKFSDYPYNLKRAYQRVPVFNENNGVATDIDILLSNTEWVMAVEVKHKLSRTDEVDYHVRRMELIRKYPPLETIGKRLVGAMAGGIVKPEVRDYIHRAGFFVLELTGESVSLVKPEVEFTPREW